MDKTYKPINSMVKPDSERVLFAMAGKESGKVNLMYYDRSEYIFKFNPETFEFQEAVYIDPSGERHEYRECTNGDKFKRARREFLESTTMCC